MTEDFPWRLPGTDTEDSLPRQVWPQDCFSAVDGGGARQSPSVVHLGTTVFNELLCFRELGIQGPSLSSSSPCQQRQCTGMG